MQCSFQGCGRPVFVKKTPHGALCNGHYAQYRKGKPLTALRQYNPRVLSDDHGACPVTDCGRPSWHKHGLCQSHQRQKWAEQNLTNIRGYTFQQNLTCSIAGCSNSAKSKGYCAIHYRTDWGLCQYAGCSRKMYNKRTGYCASHYIQFRRLTKNGRVPTNEIEKNLKPIRTKAQKAGVKITENKDG